MKKQNKYVKRDISDGYYYHLNKIVDYLNTIQSLWKEIPVFYASRFPIILSSHKGLKKKLNSIKLIYKWFFSNIVSRSKIDLNLPKVDILLFYSSIKPNWYPATEILALNLSKKGLCTALMTRDKIDIINESKIKSKEVKKISRTSHL